jgi:predicted regulator of Ras-like GTPase activity (Roadblock/LC7/MglB family)
MGFDGIPVEDVWRDQYPDPDLEITVAECSSLVVAASRANRGGKLGKLTEMTISGENKAFIVRLMSKEYFIAMILRSDGSFGRGRYELMRAGMILEPEFVHH